MKHLLIVNGTKKESKKQELEKIFSHFEGLDHEIHYTTAIGEATTFLKDYFSKEKEQEVTVYACGGDGTINEVCNGLVGFPNANMAIIPLGTGNDFVKYYGGLKAFEDIDAIIHGEKHQIDVSLIQGAEEGPIYSINVTNIGFDAYVGEMGSINARKGKKNPFNRAIPGGILKAWKNKVVVSCDGRKINDKSLFLCTMAHGKYYGGQYCCGPKSDNEDGYFEFALVKKISIFSFVKMVKSYNDGTHLDNPKFRKYFEIAKGKHAEITCEKRTGLCVDGETVHGTHFTVDVVPGAIRFIVPKKA